MFIKINFLKTQIFKKILLFLRIKKLRIFGMEKEFRNMSNIEIFNKIYKDKIWGVDKNGYSNSGAGSHLPYIIDPYIDVVNSLLYKIKPTSIVDLGCGDFNVGKNFAFNTKKYIACDVSSVIINRNKLEYKNLINVEFKQLDISSDTLPTGEVAFVRQVLQHLSNESIKKFIDQINNFKPFKYILITEHISKSDFIIENIDKPSGSRMRTRFNSGVFVHKKPFFLKSSSFQVLLDIPVDLKNPFNKNSKNTNSLIRSTLYKL